MQKELETEKRPTPNLESPHLEGMREEPVMILQGSRDETKDEIGPDRRHQGPG